MAGFVMHLLEPDPGLRPSAREALKHRVFDSIIPYPYRNQKQQRHQHQHQHQQQQQQQLKTEAPSSPMHKQPPGPFDSPRKRFGM